MIFESLNDNAQSCIMKWNGETQTLPRRAFCKKEEQLTGTWLRRSYVDDKTLSTLSVLGTRIVSRSVTSRGTLERIVDHNDLSNCKRLVFRKSTMLQSDDAKKLGIMPSGVTVATGNQKIKILHPLVQVAIKCFQGRPTILFQVVSLVGHRRTSCCIANKQILQPVSCGFEVFTWCCFAQ